jgi:hypothetical protein
LRWLEYRPSQLMQGVQATIAVAMLSRGIVLGFIIACCNVIRAKRQGPRPDPPIFPVTLFAVTFVLAGEAAAGLGGRYSH